MTWRLAQSLVVLRDQINAMYPDRDKRTDGVISGYPGAVSGHNVNAAGVVCAMDITTGDYPGGISMEQSYALADAIRNELLVAPRGLYTYIIHHMEPPYVPTPGKYIAHGGPASLWQWIPYTGVDPHTSHIHISVDEDIPTGGTGSGEDPYDMTDPWNLGGVSAQSTGITPIQEEDMTPEEHGWLQAIKEAIFDGGSSMPKGLPLKDLINNGLTDMPARIWTVTQVQRDGKSLSVIQDNANTGTDVKSVLAQVGSLSKKVDALAVPTAPATVTVDVKALAAELAPLLDSNQVEPFVTAIRNLKFAAQ